MERSGVCQAALDGNLKAVQHQIEKGAPLDGSDCESYDDHAAGCVTGAPYYMPLGEAARMGHVEITAALLDAGAPIEGVDYRNETALLLAVGADQRATTELLLSRGANVHHVGCMGPALSYTQPGWKPNANAIVTRLLELGASPLIKDAFERDTIDSWLAGMQGRGIKKPVKLGYLEGFRIVLPYAGVRTPDVQAVIARLEKELGKAATAEKKSTVSYADLAKAQGTQWRQRVRRALGSIEKESGRESIERVCKQVLAAPTAVAHADWPQIILDVLALSKTYADVTKHAYGKALPLSRIDTDEGGAMDYYADDHLYTFDWVLHVLAQPAPVASAHWASLVGAVCDAKLAAVGRYSVGDDEVAALLGAPDVKAHPQFATVVAAAKRAFPYAPCFGATGELRDFDAPKKATPKRPTGPKKKRP